MTQNEVNKKCEKINAIDLYVNQGKTGKEIGDMIGVTNHGQVYTYLSSKNIPRRKAKKRKELREVPPVGEQFGLWTVISDQIKVGSRRELLWHCQCKCGHTAWKKPYELKTGHSTRCKKCGNKSYFDETGEVEINALIKSKYAQIKHNLSTRKKVGSLPFTITPQDLQNLYDQNNHCALSGISLEMDLTKSLVKQNLSVDRIDPDKGYVPDNIQLVDKRINMMKQSLSQEEFIDLCCKVADHYRNNNGNK